MLCVVVDCGSVVVCGGDVAYVVAVAGVVNCSGMHVGVGGGVSCGWRCVVCGVDVGCCGRCG